MEVGMPSKTVQPDEIKDLKSHSPHEPTAPWLAAEELQPRQRVQSQTPLDDVDEALMESFPCSDPPSFSHAHS